MSTPKTTTEWKLVQVEPTPVDEHGEPAWRMRAYYYSFCPTGVAAIDRILSAVACAGKSVHHTMDWTDDVGPYHDGLRGSSPIEWIQFAADDAAAVLTASPAPPEPYRWQPGDEIPESVLDAVAAAIGDAYDCNRVWSAWSYGTMGPDDFSRVADDGDRVAEIAGAALEAAHAVLATPPEQAAQPAYVVAVESGAASEPNWDYVRYTAEHVTGMPVERHSYSIIVREVRRWLADRQPQIDVARLAEVPTPADVARLVEALDWIDDFIARCNGDDRGACEAVNRVRAALAAKGGDHA